MATRQAPARLTQQELRARGARATGTLREALGTPSHLADTTILGTALAEIAAEESRRNPGFARAVRDRYDEIASLRGGPATNATRPSRLPLQELIPIGNPPPGYVTDPIHAPEVSLLIRIYGRAQLGRALHDYTVDALKEVAARYEARHPGTKPANRGRRDALIAYIVDQHDRAQGG